jgi:hypothetical protein
MLAREVGAAIARLGFTVMTVAQKICENGYAA